MKSLPRINASYWLTLGMASIFGTNTGDVVSEYFHIGAAKGLPYLAALLAALFLAERASSWRTPVFFWLIIIVVRTAATNLGDAFHEYGIGFGVSLPVLLALFTASVAAYAFSSPPRAQGDDSVRVSPTYWLCMILAGALGTVCGDFVSFGLGLFPTGTAIAVGALVLVALLYGRKGLWLNPVYYWITVALIRTAGTGAGDAVGHDHLPLATAVNAVLFFGMVFYFYVARSDNRSVRTVLQGAI